MSTTTCRGQVYVVVVHKETNRAFTLTRGYKLLDELILNHRLVAVKPGQRINSTSDGWLPSGDWQRPAWIEGMLDSEFIAYWLTE